jgi:hypothetical protein
MGRITQKPNQANEEELLLSKPFIGKAERQFSSNATKRLLCGSQVIAALVRHMWKPPALAANRANPNIEDVTQRIDGSTGLFIQRLSHLYRA